MKKFTMPLVLFLLIALTTVSATAKDDDAPQWQRLSNHLGIVEVHGTFDNPVTKAQIAAAEAEATLIAYEEAALFRDGFLALGWVAEVRVYGPWHQFYAYNTRVIAYGHAEVWGYDPNGGID